VRSTIESEDFKLAEQEAAAHYKQILAERKEFDEGQVADLRRSQLDLDKAKIELQRAQNNVDMMVMKTPIDGIVVMQSIIRGGDTAQVRQGDQVYAGMAFMTIVDTSSMMLNANVNQVDSETLRVGMKATVHLDAYPDLALSATVISVGAMTDAGSWRASYVRQVPVRLKLNQSDPRVIPDLSASADIVLAAEQQVAVAPLESVFRDAPDGRPYVFVQASTGFKKREVELGLTSHVAVAVRSGVRQGEVVALTRPYLAPALQAGAS
jgi:HlyD family secretion protein